MTPSDLAEHSTVTTTLHPDLARLAARYNHILEGWQRHDYDMREAHRRIAELVARDDNGLRWTINPRDGGWLYQGRDGTWKQAAPPAAGYATLTAYELGDRVGDLPHGFNPDWDIRRETVHQARTHDREPTDMKRLVAVIAIVAVVVAGAVGVVTSRLSSSTPVPRNATDLPAATVDPVPADFNRWPG